MAFYIFRLAVVLCGAGLIFGPGCGIENDYHHFQQLTQQPLPESSSGPLSGPSSDGGDTGEIGDTGGTGTIDTGTSGAGASTEATAEAETNPEDSSSTGAGAGTPVCGDLRVEGDEECDSGDPDCHGCVRDRLVFVTSQSTSGAFASAAELRQYCNHFADLAGLLPGHQARFQPWLSGAGASAAERLQHSRGRYVLRSGAVLAESWDDLVDGELLHPPNVDELGQLREVDVWTGTLPDGSATPGAANCENWTVDDIGVIGSWGHSGYNDGRWSNWTDSELNPTTCASKSSLYCVESP